MSDRHGRVWWTELATRDPVRARDFYAGVCGWSFDEMPMGERTYFVGKVGEQMTIGILDMTGNPYFAEGVSAHWLSYFAVDDADLAVADTRAGGGQVLREPFDVPGVGRIAIVADPTGAVLGLMTPSDEAPRPD